MLYLYILYSSRISLTLLYFEFKIVTNFIPDVQHVLLNGQLNANKL